MVERGVDHVTVDDGGAVRMRRAEPADPAAHLAASLLLATWTVALIQGSPDLSTEARYRGALKPPLLAIVGKGTIGLKAAMVGTPYA
jgi:hypothetical protein